MGLRKKARLVVAIATVVGAGLVGALLIEPAGPPRERRVEMKARQYAFEPGVLKVNQGDTIRLRIVSEDVVHGFYLEGHDINAKIVPQDPYIELSRPSRPNDKPERVEEIVFVAKKAGKFRYRCSQTCGTMHPFMSGELIVAPNRLFGAGMGGVIGLLVAGLVLVPWKGKNSPANIGTQNGEV